MMSTAPARTVALTALIMTGLTLTATAQPPQTVPHPGSKMLLAQAEEPQTRGPAEEEDQEGEPERPGMNAPGMNAPGMMPPGMMAERMRRMMHGGMHRRLMLKIMFAIADTDEDGSVSFEEISAIHKRIFDMIDTNKDGKVTLEEMEAFMEN